MTTKSRRFEARVTDEDYDLVSAAAAVQNLSVSAFVLRAAAREAVEVLDQSPVIALSPKVYDAFLAELDRPQEAIPELVDLFKNHL